MTPVRGGVITVPEAAFADCDCAAIHWGCFMSGAPTPTVGQKKSPDLMAQAQGRGLRPPFGGNLTLLQH